jgi:hypothetical protein
MERESQRSARFIRELSELAERLAARDIIVRALRAEYSFFGCWEIIASKHDEAVKIFCDGRDCYFTAEGSPIRGDNSPNEWKQEGGKGFDKVSGDNPLTLVEDYLTKRFPV